MGTRLEFSTTFHPQTDGQTERVNQILEDMLRACALDYKSTWDDNLPYAEFSYNNIYQASIEMSRFEALYGRKCTTPLLWSGVGERSLFGPDIIKEAKEMVRLIKNRLKIAQSRQKSYADSKQREVAYDVGDRAYLRVSLLRGVRGLESKVSWHHDSLDLTRFYPAREKWPMSWNCQKFFLQFTMCSMLAS